MSFYKKVEKYVIDSFTEAGGEHGISHFKRTVYWLKQLKPDVDEALLIAAIAHDIERAFRAEEGYKKISKLKKDFKDEERLNYHQEEGAEIIGNYLNQLGADKNLIKRVKMLISKHEVGGNDDQNLLKDADSISFFENNVDFFVTKQVELRGKVKVKEKFDWMFERISSEKAREITQSWYEEAIKKLGY